MIYEVDGYYVISSGGTWLPGNYDTEQTARYAFQFTQDELLKLQKEICYKGKQITMIDLRKTRAMRNNGGNTV